MEIFTGNEKTNTFQCVMCAVEEGVLTAFGDVDGSLSKRRRGGEEGQREQEEEEQREGGGAHPPTAHPPTL